MDVAHPSFDLFNFLPFRKCKNSNCPVLNTRISTKPFRNRMLSLLKVNFFVQTCSACWNPTFSINLVSKCIPHFSLISSAEFRSTKLLTQTLKHNPTEKNYWLCFKAVESLLRIVKAAEELVIKTQLTFRWLYPHYSFYSSIPISCSLIHFMQWGTHKVSHGHSSFHVYNIYIIITVLIASNDPNKWTSSLRTLCECLTFRYGVKDGWNQVKLVKRNDNVVLFRVYIMCVQLLKTHCVYNDGIYIDCR